jgi:hypothetical protein
MLEMIQPDGCRNMRSVRTFPSHPYPEAHFATYPPDLIEPYIRASTSEKGCCAKCGAPWVRETEKTDSGRRQRTAVGWDTGPGGHGRQGRGETTEVAVFA